MRCSLRAGHNPVWTVDLDDFHRDGKFKLDIGNVRFKRRCEMPRVDLLHVLYALDTGREERGIVDLVEHRLRRRCHLDLALKLHWRTCFSSVVSCAAISSGFSSGVRCRPDLMTVNVEFFIPA